LWVGLLTYAGLVLGQNYKLVEKFLGPASGVVLVALRVAFGIWVVRRKNKQ
jgi:membrane protein DedA with SNARE-associated domain